MKRLDRWGFNGLVVISLVVCLAMAVLWVRGRSASDEVYINVRSHLLIAGSFPNHGDFIYYRAANYHGPLIRSFWGDKRVGPMPEFWEMRVNGNSFKLDAAAPWWILILFGLAMPVVGLARGVSRLRATRKGMCPKCGYDLRATAERCSECGTVPPNAEILKN
jgi:hypothetical protein